MVGDYHWRISAFNGVCQDVVFRSQSRRFLCLCPSFFWPIPRLPNQRAVLVSLLGREYRDGGDWCWLPQLFLPYFERSNGVDHYLCGCAVDFCIAQYCWATDDHPCSGGGDGIGVDTYRRDCSIRLVLVPQRNLHGCVERKRSGYIWRYPKHLERNALVIYRGGKCLGGGWRG